MKFVVYFVILLIISVIIYFRCSSDNDQKIKEQKALIEAQNKEAQETARTSNLIEKISNIVKSRNVKIWNILVQKNCSNRKPLTIEIQKLISDTNNIYGDIFSIANIESYKNKYLIRLNHSEDSEYSEQFLIFADSSQVFDYIIQDSTAYEVNYFIVFKVDSIASTIHLSEFDDENEENEISYSVDFNKRNIFGRCLGITKSDYITTSQLSEIK